MTTLLGLVLVSLLLLVGRVWHRQLARARSYDGRASSREVSRRHARERHRRSLQIQRGILRRQNGLGVVITSRPAREISGRRPALRRVKRQVECGMRRVERRMRRAA